MQKGSKMYNNKVDREMDVGRGQGSPGFEISYFSVLAE